MARAGVIGLGNMGAGFAARLLEQGYETYGYDVSQAAIDRFVAAGGKAADRSSIGECEIVVSSLPADKEVLETFDEELLAKLSGGVIIEVSTILPSTIIELAARAERHSVTVIDCPVSGGAGNAKAGNIVLLVGADDAVLEANRKILEDLGTIMHVGATGHGKIVKLVNNMMSLGNVAVAVEAFELGVSLGMESQQLYDILNQSGGRSFHFTGGMPSVIARKFEPGFATYLGEKDLRLALQMAHDHKYPMPIAASVHQLYEMAAARGYSNESVFSVIKIYEEWAGDEH